MSQKTDRRLPEKINPTMTEIFLIQFMHEVGKDEGVVQGYYSGNLGGAVSLTCVSTLTKTGGVMNLVFFWTRTIMTSAGIPFKLGAFLQIADINSITGNLLNCVLHKKFSSKSIYSCNTWQIHEEFKIILRFFCYHSPDVMKLCLDFRCLRAHRVLSFS